MRDERPLAARARVGSLLVGFFLAGCQAPPAEPGPLAEADAAAIRDAVGTLQRSALEGDWATYAAQFAEDGVALPPNGPAVEGRQAIQEWASAYSVSVFTMNQLNLEGRGDLAYRRGSFSITLTPPGMREEVSDEGKFVEIWRRQEDGSWKVAVDIWNSSQPSPGPARTESRPPQ